MPVSRTGIELYYPPQYRVEVEPGPFRIDTYEEPGFREATNEPAAGAMPAQTALNLNQQAAQKLIDQFRAQSEARIMTTANLLRTEVPALGPSLFVASELTAENQSPTVQLTYELDKKRSAR
jgi:hypothetical protein